MGNLTSRVLVAAILLPVALLVLWLGSWWLVGLAVVVAVLALHELWTMAREQRPVMIAGYVGAVAVVLAAEFHGVAGPDLLVAGAPGLTAAIRNEINLDPPAVAADHPGTVTNRVGHCASQHGRVVEVPIPVAKAR